MSSSQPPDTLFDEGFYGICHVCGTRDLNIVFDDYVENAMLWCDNCSCRIIFNTKGSDVDTGMMLKPLYIHSVVNADALDNAWCWMKEHNGVLPLLTIEERKQWANDKHNRSEYFKYESTREDDLWNDAQKCYVARCCGMPVQAWELDQRKVPVDLSHDGIYVMLETSETPESDERTCYFFWGD